MRFCPLVAAWATTIHKFQGSEAGNGEFAQFKYLIINPSDKRWEQQQPGTLYISLSRGKTMGNEDHEETQHFPKPSSVYWVGDGMCIDHIINSANKIYNTNRLNKTTKCEKVKKRDEWVKYLLDKAKTTNANNTVNMTFEVMINMTKRQIYTGNDVIQRILTITTIQTTHGQQQKRGDVYNTRKLLYVIKNNIKRNI